MSQHDGRRRNLSMSVNDGVLTRDKTDSSVAHFNTIIITHLKS